MFTITSISTGITSLFFLISSISTFRSWRKNKDPLFLSFFYFFFFFGIMQFMLSLATGIFSQNTSASNACWMIAHVFVFLAISNFIRFPIHIKYPQLEKKVFGFALAISAIALSILYLKLPEVKPFLLDNGVYNWIIPSLSGATIGITVSISFIFSAWIFVSEGIHSQDKVIKAKSFLIAIGILFFLIGGPTHNFVKTPLLNFIADFILILGSLFMLFGVYFSHVFIAPEKRLSDK